MLGIRKYVYKPWSKISIIITTSSLQQVHKVIFRYLSTQCLSSLKYMKPSGYSLKLLFSLSMSTQGFLRKST